MSRVASSRESPSLLALLDWQVPAAFDVQSDRGVDCVDSKTYWCALSSAAESSSRCAAPRCGYTIRAFTSEWFDPSAPTVWQRLSAHEVPTVAQMLGCRYDRVFWRHRKAPEAEVSEIASGGQTIQSTQIRLVLMAPILNLWIILLGKGQYEGRAADVSSGAEFHV